jgi:hypothetical protein
MKRKDSLSNSQESANFLLWAQWTQFILSNYIFARTAPNFFLSLKSMFSKLTHVFEVKPTKKL